MIGTAEAGRRARVSESHSWQSPSCTQQTIYFPLSSSPPPPPRRNTAILCSRLFMPQAIPLALPSLPPPFLPFSAHNLAAPAAAATAPRMNEVEIVSASF